MTENNELDIQETLKFLKIGRSTLYRLMDEGKIKPIEHSPLLSRPRKLRFRKDELEKLLSDNEPVKEESEQPANIVVAA